MNLEEALRTIEGNMVPGMTIECWMLSNGSMMRAVEVNEYRVFSRNNQEWESAIEAWKILAPLATATEDFTDRYPDTLAMSAGIKE